MENNKRYLHKLPLIFLMLVASITIQVFFWKYDSTVKDKNYLVIFARSIFYEAVFFVCLGIALNRWKKAMISLGIASLITCLEIYLYTEKPGDSVAASRNYIIIELLSLVPYIFFVIEKNLGFKKIATVIAAIILFRGITAVYYFPRWLEWVDDLLSTHLETNGNYARVVVISCLNIIKLVFYCELLNFVRKASMPWQPRLLNPGNIYDKAGATILFFSLKVFLVTLVIGQYYQMSGLRFFVSNRSGSSFEVYHYNAMLCSLFAVVVALACAWYLRKFLLEYFISYNISSRFVYWLLLLPGIGFIVWLILLANERTKTFSEKVTAINNFASSSSQGVTAVIVILMIFQLLFSITNEADGGINVLAIIIGLIFFFWMVNQRSGYYFNLYFTLSVLAIMLTYIFFRADKRELVALSVLSSLLLYNVAQIVLIYPVYHYEDFTYINDEEKAVDESENRLTEFEV